MKKKLLLTLLVVMTLVCLFTIAVSAENVYDKTEKFTTADGTELALYDASGAPLAWFKDPTSGNYVSYRVGVDFTMALNSGRELLPATVISDTDGDDNTAFPYTVSDMILLNGREYAAFTYISGTWSSMPIQAIYVNNTFRWINKQSFNNNNTLKVFDIPKDHTGSLHIGAAFVKANALENFYIPKGATFESTSTFEYSTGIKSVEFHKEWEGALKGYEFNSCTALKTAILADTIKSIPTKLFYNCSSLTTVNIPSGVTTISSEAFRNCSSLTSITIPENVTLVDNYAFAGAGLVTITFESKGALEKFGNAVFEKCTSLTKLEIPEGVTYLGNCFAKNCSSLTSLSLPSTLETLYDNGHFNGTSLTSIKGLENTKLTKIPYAAFQGAIDSNIGTLRIPVTCTYIATYAFADCKVETVILSPALVQMDGEAFVNCPGLKNVYVPGGLTTVGGSTFKNNHTGNICFFVTSTNETYLESAKGWFDCKDIVTLETYNSDKATYATGRHIISGLNLCETFYNGHDTEGVVGVNQFKGDDYVTDYICVSGCNRNCGAQAETKLCGPLFTNKGYSKIADGTMFTYGIVIDEENIAKYVELSGKAFNYGVIIGAANFDSDGNLIETNAIIDNTGKALIESSIVVDFSKVELENFTIYNVKMQGIETEAQRNLPIYCCAYIIDGESVFYMGNEVTENAKTISSSTITVIETTTTTPPATGDDQNA